MSTHPPGDWIGANKMLVLQLQQEILELSQKNDALKRNNRELTDQRFELMEWVGKLNAKNERLRAALVTCATTLNQAGFRKQADIAYAALGEKA